MSYELFQRGPAVYIPILLLSLIITVVAYGAFPLIFAATRKNPITKKTYRGLCYGINIAVTLIFLVINGGSFGGGSYLLWTWAFSSWGIRILETRGILTDGIYIANTPNCVTECQSCGYRDKNFFNACPECGRYAKRYVCLTEESKAVADRILFCRKCGRKLIENSKYCGKCGTKIIQE